MTYTWTQEGRRWTLDADPRYAVQSRGTLSGYEMLIDGFEVDTASTLPEARVRLEARYEYEEHAADLELARLRLRQAQERLTERFPRGARDPKLASILAGLGDALGNGPAAGEGAPAGDRWRVQLSPDLALAVDDSQCIVFEVSDSYGHVVRRPVVSDAARVREELRTAQALQRELLDKADEQRRTGPDEKCRAEGRYTRPEAAQFLYEATRRQRTHIIAVLDRARQYAHLKGQPERFESARGNFLVSYDGTYWIVAPAASETVR